MQAVINIECQTYPYARYFFLLKKINVFISHHLTNNSSLSSCHYGQSFNIGADFLDNHSSTKVRCWAMTRKRRLEAVNWKDSSWCYTERLRLTFLFLISYYYKFSLSI